MKSLQCGVDLDVDVTEAVKLLATEMKLPRSQLLSTIVRDWLIRAGRLRADDIDEESETDGRA
jgi:hypothetical protein